MPNESPHILERLKALPPNHIYALAPKDYILRGYDYYSRERLEFYKWNTDRTLLTAYVKGSQRYSVQLSAHEPDLRYTCDCPAWTSTSQCKHVICALLTTINALVPETFSLPGNHTARRNVLRKELLPPSSSHSLLTQPMPSASRLEVVLSDHESLPNIAIKKDGTLCRSFYGIPTELTLLMRGTFDPAWLAYENFITYLEQYGNTHPLVFDTQEEQTTLTWRPSRHYHSATELDVREDHIDVHNRCLLRGTVHPNARPFQRLVADLETQTLAPLHDTKGWEIYTLIENMLETEIWRRPLGLRQPHILSVTKQQSEHTRTPPSRVPGTRTPHQPLQLPIEAFGQLQINFSRKEDIAQHLILKINGRNVPLQEFDLHEHSTPSLTYRLSILPSDDVTAPIQANLREPLATLQTECRLGGHNIETHAQLFQAILIIEQAKDLPHTFRSRKRKTLLLETLFRLFGTMQPTDATRIIKDAMTANDFQAYAVKSEAQHLLKNWHTLYREQDFRLAYADNQWGFFPNDKTKQALLYAIPYEMFGLHLFRNMNRHDRMTIPLSALHAKLPELHAKLQAAGIELFYHQKPILTSEWEFSFDAQRPRNIDWFEIRPEIKCNGVVMSEATWLETMQKGSVSETEEGVRILDVNAMEILRTLSSLYPAMRNTPSKDQKSKVVRVPTLQILDWMVLRKHGVNIVLSEHDEALFQRLLNFEKIDPVPLPDKLNAKLRTYQRRGYQWLSFLYEHRFGACLADDMGLGKTLQAISLLAGIQEGLVTQPTNATKAPHLVVLPPSLLFNWEHEITRFYPDFTVRWYSGKDRTPQFDDCDIILTTYGIIRRDIEILEKMPFNVIIFDEAQAIKNITAHSTGAARRLKGTFKLAMTGTPLENHLGEYYSIIDLCLPGLLGDYDTFKSQIKPQDPPRVEQLLQRTKPFVLRRTKSETLKELPPKIETDVYLDLTDRQKALYQQTIAQIRPTIEDAYRTKTAAQARIIALTAILKLRQICLSPRLLNATSTDSSPKITCLLDRLHELLDEGHSALVFSQFTSFLDLVEQEFTTQHLPYSRLDGSTPTKTRKKLVQTFQESEQPSVFLLSLKAGGQGLNLTKASYVFHLDPWWNPAVENQASDRAHRIGQQQKVSIMRFLMHHTIEEKMMDLKKHKLALYDAVMEGSTQRGAGAGISKSDFDFLLG
ncbi:DEAD/DEAH box helicase [Nitrospira sp. M1]